MIHHLIGPVLEPPLTRQPQFLILFGDPGYDDPGAEVVAATDPNLLRAIQNITGIVINATLPKAQVEVFDDAAAFFARAAALWPNCPGQMADWVGVLH